MMKNALLSLLFALPLVAQPAPAPQQADMTIDATMRREAIDGALRELEASYVFPEKAKTTADAVRARVRAGEYDSITSATAFAKKLTDDLQATIDDRHVRVSFRREPIPQRAEGGGPSSAERERADEVARRTNYGFERVERLAGNVGYVDIRFFNMPADGNGRAGETAVAAMNLLANTDAIIFDLRQHRGGSPQMIALLLSYLQDDGTPPVHLIDFAWRGSDDVQQSWTLPHVPGRRFGGSKPVYVLTSSFTFSAGEEFAYDLRHLERATLVGETTGGGANPGGSRRIHDHFSLFVPQARAINAITKSNWEGVGVVPHVAVPKEQALKTAHLAALRKVTETATAEHKEWLQRAIGVVEKGM